MRAEEIFWNWFKKNENELLHSLNPSVFSELRNQLDMIHPLIDVEFILTSNQKSSSDLGSPTQEKSKIIFTTNGHMDVVPHVTRLLNFAPVLDHWKLVPFKPRRDFTEGLIYNGVHFKVESLHFHYEKQNNGSINLDLYCDEFEELEEGEVKELCLCLLEMALGEFDLFHRIEDLHIHLMSDPRSPHLLPFSDIVEVVDSLKKSRV